jgi:hypothetical protein
MVILGQVSVVVSKRPSPELQLAAGGQSTGNLDATELIVNFFMP